MFDIHHLVTTVGYLGLFAIIFFESGVVVGLFLPGDSLLFTAGFLASQGYFNIWFLLPVFFVAAYLGDQVGYYIGKRAGPKIFTREKSFFFNPAHVATTRAFFERHGKKAVILARFIPVARALAPVLAGVGEMQYSSFVRYNLVGAFLWAVCLTLAGYGLGNVIPSADRYLIPIIGVIILVSFVPAVLEFLRERKKSDSV